MKPLFISFLLSLAIVAPVVAQNTYWQQFVEYNIEVSLNDLEHSLHGNFEMVYHNQSPNDLDFIYIHLYPNAYSCENTALCDQLLSNGNADLYFATEDEKGKIDSLHFSSEGVPLKLIYDLEHSDIAKVMLPKPLKSGEKIKISTPFYVKIPSSKFSRMGHSDQSYQITQWHPKPAVYDAQGWHAMPYLNLGEFYSEYANYDVKISLPENYRVAATGDLVDGEVEEKWLQLLSEETSQINAFSNDLSFPPSSEVIKTLHFSQKMVHDFAWFADKRYHVMLGKVELDSGQQVVTQIMFTNQEAELWKDALEYLSKSVWYYSNRLGAYPFKRVSAVQGTLSAGAGMEYPNITIIGEAQSKIALEEVIMHEVGHNWFYGILGFNERDFPWMDEGLNTFYQTQYMNHFYPHLGFIEDYTDRLQSMHLPWDYPMNYEYFLANKFAQSANLHQPSTLTSSEYGEGNYGIIIYYKSALLFKYLEQYLGADEFNRIMKAFYEKWKNKHPQPNDFEACFKAESKKNLDWFFNDLMATKNSLNYALRKAKTQGDSLELTLVNKGKIAAPVQLEIQNGDSLHSLWIEGFDGKQTLTIPHQNKDTLWLNRPFYMLEYDTKNNVYRTNQKFAKFRVPHLKLLFSIPKTQEAHLYLSPVMGWNAYNKFMIGGLIYNHAAFEKKWEFELMPMYAFGTKDLNGFGALRRNFYTQGFIQRLSVSVRVKSYGYQIDEFTNSYFPTFNHRYLKVSPEVLFYFKNPFGITRLNHQLQLRFVNISKQKTHYNFVQDSLQTIAVYTPEQVYQNIFVFDAVYSYLNKRMINPFGIVAHLQANHEMIKADLRLNYFINYNRKNRGLEASLFMGNFFSQFGGMSLNYSYKMANWEGKDDYLYDHTFFGRSETTGWLSAQSVASDGGFYLPSPVGRSYGFMAALNLRTTFLPFTRVLQIYGNLGTTKNPSIMSFADNRMLYETGFIVSIIHKQFEIYFPALWSKEFQNAMDTNPDHTYFNNVRFTLTLDLYDPFKALKNVHL